MKYEHLAAGAMARIAVDMKKAIAEQTSGNLIVSTVTNEPVHDWIDGWTGIADSVTWRPASPSQASPTPDRKLARPWVPKLPLPPAPLIEEACKATDGPALDQARATVSTAIKALAALCRRGDDIVKIDGEEIDLWDVKRDLRALLGPDGDDRT